MWSPCYGRINIGQAGAGYALFILNAGGVFLGRELCCRAPLVTEADPVILSQLRWLVTAVLLMTLYFSQVKQQWEFMKKAKGIILFLSLCGQVLFPVTLYIGLQYTTALMLLFICRQRRQLFY